MGREIIFNDSYVRGTLSQTIDTDISDEEDLVKSTREKIYTLMVTSPGNYKDSDGNDVPWPEYVYEHGTSLLDDFEKHTARRAKLCMAKSAIDQKTFKIYVCGKCRKYVPDNADHFVWNEQEAKYEHVCDCGSKDVFEVELPTFIDSY